MHAWRHRFVVLLSLIASCCVSGAIGAQAPQSWNGWRFAAPAGWQAQPTGEAMVLTPPDASATSTVRLLAPQPVTGTFAQWFAQAVAAQARQLRGFRLGGQVKAAKTSEGVPTLLATGQAVSTTGQRLVASFLGMEDGRGQGLLMVAEFDQAGALRNLRAYGLFANTLEPGSRGVAGAGSVPPPLAPGEDLRRPSNSGAGSRASAALPNADLAAADATPPAQPSGHGLYDWFGSFYNAVMPGPNFTISTSMRWEFYRFFPNGWMYEGWPSGRDPATINCTGPAHTKDGDCKHYTLSGGMLSIEGEKPQSFAETSSGIKVGGTEKNRVRPARGTLSGTWKTSSGGGVLTTVTLSQHLLTLRPDGSFAIQGSTGVSGANVAAYNSSAMNGHYKLNGYTIEMDYANGRVVRQSFLLPYSNNKVFLIGDSMYFVPTK